MANDTETELHRALARRVDRYCPRWMSDQIDDIVQTAWLRLQTSMEKNEANRNPGTTLIARVAYCAVIDETRRRRSRREVSGLQERIDAMPQQAESSPEQAARSREIDSGIRDCLGKMTDNRSMSVTLHLQGHNAREIATLLAWPHKKARNAVFRGMSDLRLCLEQRGLTP
jgi:RNA polymerase sigma factor (sigma-70 family)